MPSLKERAKTLLDLIDGAHFLFADRPIALDDKAKALLTAGRASAAARHRAPSLPASSPGPARQPNRRCAPSPSSKGAKLGAVAQPLRAALTGRTTSPGIFEVLAVLGKAESLARIADQAKRRRPQPARRLSPRTAAMPIGRARNRPRRLSSRPIILQCTRVALPNRAGSNMPPQPH